MCSIIGSYWTTTDTAHLLNTLLLKFGCENFGWGGGGGGIALGGDIPGLPPPPPPPPYEPLSGVYKLERIGIVSFLATFGSTASDHVRQEPITDYRTLAE